MVKYDLDVLSPVVTSLYRDPANVYIRHESMIFMTAGRRHSEPSTLDRQTS